MNAGRRAMTAMSVGAGMVWILGLTLSVVRGTVTNPGPCGQSTSGVTPGDAGGQGLLESSSGGSTHLPSLPGGPTGQGGLPSEMGSSLGPQYQVIDTSGWPMLQRTDPAAPTGGWITDPVVVNSGEMIFHARDLLWPHDGTFAAVDRLYRHQTLNEGGATTDFGRYFHTNLRIRIDETGQLAGHVPVSLGNGEILTFILQDGQYVSPASWERYTLEKIGGTQFRLTDRNGYRYWFKPNASPSNLISTRNRYGQGEDYSYDVSNYLIQITTAFEPGSGTTPPQTIYLDRDTAHAITLIRDYADRSVKYQYDGNSNLTKVEDACGSCSTIPTAEYAYDGSNRITLVKDAYGQTVRQIAYSGGRVDYYVDANGGTFDFAYNGVDFAIDPEGNTTGYVFDGSGRPTSKIFGYGTSGAATYTYAYDGSNRVTGATLPSGASASGISYDAKGNLLTVSYAASGLANLTTFAAAYSATYSQVSTVNVAPFEGSANLETYEYGTSGELLTDTRPGNLSRSYKYDAKGLVTSSLSITSDKAEYAYNAVGFLTTTTTYTGGNGTGSGQPTGYTLDDLGHALTTASPESRQVFREFDKGGRVTTQTSDLGIVTRFEYDANGRATVRKIMDGGSPLYTWTTQYDAAGRVSKTIAPDSSETSYAYDKAGRMTKQTEPSGLVTERVYDGLGRVVTTKTGDGGGTTIAQTLVYDTMGHVVSSRDADNNATVHTYDAYGRLLSTTDPLGHYTVYEYEAMRQTAVKRYASDNTLLTHTQMAYDQLGRVTLTRQKADPGGADGNSDAVTTTEYDGEDRVLKQIVYYDASNANTTTNVYDGAGRLSTVTDADGNATTYAYDLDGLRTKATDPNSRDTTYTYDGDGRQVTVTNALGDYTVTEYEQRGLQTQVSQYANGGVLKARTKYGYDAAGRQTLSRQQASPGTDSNDRDYIIRSLHNSGGQLTGRVSASGNTTNYAYDQHGRQSQVTLPDGSYTRSDFNASGRMTSQVQYEIVGANTRSFRHDYTLDALGRAVTTTNQGPDGTFGNGDDLNVPWCSGLRVSSGQPAAERHQAEQQQGQCARFRYGHEGHRQPQLEDVARGQRCDTVGQAVVNGGRQTRVEDVFPGPRGGLAVLQHGEVVRIRRAVEVDLARHLDVVYAVTVGVVREGGGQLVEMPLDVPHERYHVRVVVADERPGRGEVVEGQPADGHADVAAERVKQRGRPRRMDVGQADGRIDVQVHHPERGIAVGGDFQDDRAAGRAEGADPREILRSAVHADGLQVHEVSARADRDGVIRHDAVPLVHRDLE